jgi:hypothetical protein
MKFLLPFVPSASPDSRSVLATRRRPDATVTIGLIDNGKPHAHELLVGIADALVRRGVGGDYFTVRKLFAGQPMPDEQRAEMLARAHLVISGVGV